MDLGAEGAQCLQLIFCTSAILLVVAFAVCSNKNKKLIPGPMGVPFIGSLYIFNSPSPHRVLTKLAGIYGPVFSVNLGAQRAVVLNSVDVVKEALLRNGSDFSGRPTLFSFTHLSAGRQKIFAGHCAKDLFAKKHFVMKSLLNNPEVLVKRVSNISMILKDKFSVTEGSYFNPSPFTSAAVAELMFRTVFGDSLPRWIIEEAQIVLQETVYTLRDGDRIAAVCLDFVPSTRFLFKRTSQKLENSSTQLLNFVRKVCNFKRDRMLHINHSNKLNNNLSQGISRCVHSNGESLFEGQNEETCSRILAEIFTTGYEKLSTALQEFIVLLAMNSQLQENIYKEISDATQNKDLAAAFFEAKHQLVLLEATVIEALRFSCVSPLAIPHCTIKDTTVAGYEVPKGTTVLVNLWACGRDTKYFVDPKKFDPYRFIDDENSTQLKKDSSFLSFSLGERKCAGDVFTKCVLMLMAGNLLQDFQISVHHGITGKEQNELAFSRRHCKIKAVLRSRS